MIKVFNFFEKYNKPVVFGGIVLAVLFFFDKKLLAGAILVFFLVFLALFFINKIKNEKQKKLKILYVGNFSPNSVGEPEIAWALEKLGHKVALILPKFN